MAITPKQTRINQLEVHHLASYNTLSPSVPQSSTAHAASLGISATEAAHRLSLLVDQGLAIRARGSVVGKDGKTYAGSTLDSFTQAA